MRSFLLPALIVFSTGLFNQSEAHLLYSIDRGRDMLIRIDTTSAQTTDVGPLGLNVGSVEGLSLSPDGFLYSTSTVFGYTGFRLLRIDPTTGHADDVMRINATETEGLAVDQNGTIYISYSTVPSTVVSDQLAIVDTDTHTVTDVGLPAFDMDGLCFDPLSNVLYGTDASGSKGAPVYEFSSHYPSVTYHKLGRIPAPNSGVGWLAVLGDGTAFALDTDQYDLIHFQLQSFEVLSITPVPDIRGLALPEPATGLSVLVFSCISLLLSRPRSRRPC